MDEVSTRRKGIVRAVLAGGLVLGVGAAVTLAAWTDQEFATGAFGAGEFNLEGSVDGAAFADHENAAGAAILTFQTDPLNLAPDDVVAVPFAVRLAADTSSGALVSTSSTGAGLNAANLTYRIFTTATFGCTASTVPAAPGDVVVDAGTALTATPAGTFPVTTGTPTTAPGDQVNLCIQVTAGAGLTQGDPASATWQFVAVSQP